MPNNGLIWAKCDSRVLPFWVGDMVGLVRFATCDFEVFIGRDCRAKHGAQTD